MLMIEHRERLALGVEPYDPLVVESASEELECHSSANRTSLVGEPDRAHSSLTEQLDENVGTDLHSGRIRQRADVCRQERELHKTPWTGSSE
jgi:hypothetical protein